MSHLLNASDLAELCSELELTEALAALEQAAQLAGEAIAQKLGVEIVDPASTQRGFAGLCVGFGPATEGQTCPEQLRFHDQGSDWAWAGGAEE